MQPRGRPSGNHLLVAAEAQINYPDQQLWVRKDLNNLEPIPIAFEGTGNTVVAAEMQPSEPDSLFEAYWDDVI